LADPRIGWSGVTAVHVADDGRSAQVLVDVDGDDEERRQFSKAARGQRIIRHELVERLRLRRAPELYFRLTVRSGKRREWKTVVAGEKDMMKPRADRVRKGITMLQDVLHQSSSVDRFVLTSHARPDGDAIDRRWLAARFCVPW